jgi:carbon-monoxide dehydrogenase small subunit
VVTEQQIELRVNGTTYTRDVTVNRGLLDVLRDDLGLTGTKEGCGTGDCGACTILLDDKPVNACLVLAVEASNREVLTVEGLARGGELDPLQAAFIREGAVQCGFCTSGMLMLGKGVLMEHPAPTEAQVRHAIAGDLCRCTGYIGIVRAIQAASQATGPNGGR